MENGMPKDPTFVFNPFGDEVAHPVRPSPHPLDADHAHTPKPILPNPIGDEGTRLEGSTASLRSYRSPSDSISSGNSLLGSAPTYSPSVFSLNSHSSLASQSQSSIVSQSSRETSLSSKHDSPLTAAFASSVFPPPAASAAPDFGLVRASSSSLRSVRSIHSTPSSPALSGPVEEHASEEPVTLPPRPGASQPREHARSIEDGGALPPLAGYRIPATSADLSANFPLLDLCGPAFADHDGHPLYLCSAIMGNSVHPAKAGPHLIPPVRVGFAGFESAHDGRYDLLPITPEMKWIPASGGRIPEGYTPVQGGYEESGDRLFHAVAKINGFWVPGKTAPHLQGANFPYGGREIPIGDNYRILCWINEYSERRTTPTQKTTCGPYV